MKRLMPIFLAMLLAVPAIADLNNPPDASVFAQATNTPTLADFTAALNRVAGLEAGLEFTPVSEFDYTTNGDSTINIGGALGVSNPRKHIVVPPRINGLSVASLRPSAFIGETNVLTITLPASITNIGSEAFAYCSRLQGVYFEGNAPECDGSAFSATTSSVFYLSGATGFYDHWRVFNVQPYGPAVAASITKAGLKLLPSPGSSNTVDLGTDFTDTNAQARVMTLEARPLLEVVPGNADTNVLSTVPLSSPWDSALDHIRTVYAAASDSNAMWVCGASNGVTALWYSSDVEGRVWTLAATNVWEPMGLSAIHVNGAIVTPLSVLLFSSYTNALVRYTKATGVVTNFIPQGELSPGVGINRSGACYTYYSGRAVVMGGFLADKAHTTNSVVESWDEGASWSRATNAPWGDLGEFGAGASWQYNAAAVVTGGIVVAGSFEGSLGNTPCAWFSADCTNWTQIATNAPAGDLNVSSIGDRLFGMEGRGGHLLSEDGGATWLPWNTLSAADLYLNTMSFGGRLFWPQVMVGASVATNAVMHIGTEPTYRVMWGGGVLEAQ